MHTRLYNSSITKYIYTCLVYKCTCTCTCCTHNYRVHFTSLKKTRSEREIHTFLETKVFKIYFSLITFKGTGTCTDLGRLGEGGGADYFPPGKLYFHILCKPPPNALDPTPTRQTKIFLGPPPLGKIFWTRTWCINWLLIERTAQPTHFGLGTVFSVKN